MAEAMSEEVLSAGRRGSPLRFIIGGGIIVAVVAYLILSSMDGATQFYLTVAEVKDLGAQAMEKKVRVAGLVADGSIEYDERNMDLRFEIEDDSGRLPVFYHGVRPDMFQEDAEAVLEGRLDEHGTFQADNMLLKCPSKYEEAATDDATAGR